MADMMISLKEIWLEYYPIVVTGLIAITTFVAGAYVLYTQAMKIVQPILDKIQLFRDNDDEKAVEGSVLENIKIDILKADLLAKISSTAISPELTMVYQTQLDKLDGITSTVLDKVDNVEEITNKYT